jgi:hypothetical protein
MARRPLCDPEYGIIASLNVERSLQIGP